MSIQITNHGNDKKSCLLFVRTDFVQTNNKKWEQRMSRFVHINLSIQITNGIHLLFIWTDFVQTNNKLIPFVICPYKFVQTNNQVRIRHKTQFKWSLPATTQHLQLARNAGTVRVRTRTSGSQLVCAAFSRRDAPMETRCGCTQLVTERGLTIHMSGDVCMPIGTTSQQQRKPYARRLRTARACGCLCAACVSIKAKG